MQTKTNTTNATGSNRWRFAVDRGGTFTDIIGIAPDGQHHACKLLSQSSTYPDAAIEGIRRLLGLGQNEIIPARKVAWIRLGTTVATNALLERKGSPVGLLITKGFRDLLEIGTQQRPELFALAIKKTEKLYQAVAEIPERMNAQGKCLESLNTDAIKTALQSFKSHGIKAIAIVFLHSWKNPQHEQQAAEIARHAGFEQVSPSHATLSLIQAVGRGQTTLVDAYLTPVLKRYIRQVRQWTGDIPIHFMSSAGTLLPPEGFSGKDAILSGPAGGVLGVQALAETTGDSQSIGFDMGGTSTDVCRYDGALERTLEVETAGIRYQAAMLHVETVAAGGGSILSFDGRKLTVGPDSAGANPGPACYGLGGPATITDANVVLGRIVAHRFPKAFGPQRNSALDATASHTRFIEISKIITEKTGNKLSPEALALGFLQVANETMSRPVKALSVARGFDLRQHGLVSFGGAGGQHACAIASILDMVQIRIHPLAGLLSAWGIANARHSRQHIATRMTGTSATELNKINTEAQTICHTLEQQLLEELVMTSAAAQPRFDRQILVDLRTPGTETPLTIPFHSDPSRLIQRFRNLHRQYYGFSASDTPPELVNLRVEVILISENTHQHQSQTITSGNTLHAVEHQHVWFDSDGPVSTPLYQRDDLPIDQIITGPALIIEPHSVIVVEPGFDASRNGDGLLTLTKQKQYQEHVTTKHDPILLALFNHRFMGIASQMGETLARTAHSVNIKERWDFSCAIFDQQGRLIANAPHIPVHLGAMGETVYSLIQHSQTKGNKLQSGDAYITNDPLHGGSHLPDVTVISPLFRQGKPAFFVASRGHHADIGGTVPGSMPPFATTLIEEGVVFSNLLAVRDGQLQETAIMQTLNTKPWPARNLSERLSDLRAQIAANNRGLSELNTLCDRYGDDVITAYMDHMRENAAAAMTHALDRLLGKNDRLVKPFKDHLDDCEIISVTLTLTRDTQDKKVHAIVDFNGSGATHTENLNAPKAVVRAAVLYVFRTLIQDDIPLNDGCLDPIEIRIPNDSLLNPRPGAAVSGGNVETSQRVVDVLYGALGVAAASQGTMNNFLFGRPDGTGTQYYETIAGGSGAIEGAHGASGVQVHMTNTRITDPEVLEYRFPKLLLTAFSLRNKSGGLGRWHGGDGVVRRFYFLEPLSITLLSQRRNCTPFGLNGGQPGKMGINRLIRADGTEEILPGRYQGEVACHDTLEISTPGGGGFGSIE
ncbi:MAG: hydantoinase B/oxoprolinase family protein [Magnetococcales bacterium]|nr:hydantoinase B/oxoprolinase family protein [Magnetococcales bacterium]